MTSDRFFSSLIAAIKSVMDEDARLTADRISLNRAFYQALLSEAGHFVDRKELAIDYDPLYGVSPWFERALTRAQRDLLISFPNPTYEKVDIKLRKDQAEKLLEKTGMRDEFLQLAREFMSNISVTK